MKLISGVLFLTLSFSGLLTWAKSTVVVQTPINGINYTCRPIETEVACPTFPAISSISFQLYVMSCLNDLKSNSDFTHVDEINCFKNYKGFKEFGDKVQHLDLPDKCIDSIVWDCGYYLNNSDIRKDAKITDDELDAICRSYYE